VSNISNIGIVDDAPGSWMHHLVDHFRAMRSRHPHQQLAVVFDIDGTIIDTRHLIRHTLLLFDRARGTDHFRSLALEEIDVHETEIEMLLSRFDLTGSERADVLAYYAAQLWTHDTLLAAHQPYRGVMEVIRWFQLQPNTVVALNTGRPEMIRRATLLAMNELGREFRVSFPDDLLLMNAGGWGEDVVGAKNAALAALRARGMRIVAVVDNEPENLEAMAHADETGDALFLHASTIFLSARRAVPRSFSGEHYDLHPFVSETDLQGHVQLVWSDVVDRETFAAFLDRSVRTLAVPVRLDPYGRAEIARRSDELHLPPALDLAEVVHAVADAGRALRLDLQTGGPLLDEVGHLVRRADLPPGSLWFHGEFHELGERGTRQLRARFPEATISCPVDFLGPLVFGALEHALDLLDVLRRWGVDRLQVAWSQPRVRDFVAELERWGREVDVSGIHEPEALLQAALLLPRSVTATAPAFTTVPPR
jgi:beta-phosphoglucomutase-like phosphatase (HAD superfamily)